MVVLTIGVRGASTELRKVFFFEKKNQKTFARGGCGPSAAGNEQKFFASFFRKGSPSFPCLRTQLAKYENMKSE
jgi:hypothetical protein